MCNLPTPWGAPVAWCWAPTFTTGKVRAWRRASAAWARDLQKANIPDDSVRRLVPQGGAHVTIGSDDEGELGHEPPRCALTAMDMAYKMPTGTSVPGLRWTDDQELTIKSRAEGSMIVTYSCDKQRRRGAASTSEIKDVRLGMQHTPTTVSLDLRRRVHPDSGRNRSRAGQSP